MTFPMASLVPADSVTGSSTTVPFGRLLDAEDRRREKAAMNTALDPQGDGATVHWENAKSGAKGAITATGKAYPADGKVCRAFLGDLKHDDLDRSVRGTACIVTAGEWAVRDVEAITKG